MQVYNSRELYSGDKEKEFLVSSNRCQYVVWISEDEVSLKGPGVDESTDLEESLEFDSTEDQAIYFVLLFENGLWP